MNRAYQKLGELLLAHQAITEAQLGQALELQANTNRRLGEILVERGYVSEETITECLAQQYSCRTVDPDEVTPSVEALKVVDVAEALAKRVLPVSLDERELFCVICDPLNLPVTDDLAQRVRRALRFAIAPESRLLEAIRKHYRVSKPEDSTNFAKNMPSRYVEPEFRGTSGGVSWADATDTELGRRVTLFKVLQYEAWGEEHWKLIKNAATRLDSRFVPIYDSVCENGCRWTSVELIRGESLAFVLGAGARTPAQAAEIVSEVANAAHETAVSSSRRPWICPENVWIDGNTTLIVPAIPAPPQYAEFATDVEALGSLLMHCLSGTFNAFGMEPGVARRVPNAMLRVLERCLTSRVDERFSNAKELAGALTSFQWTITTGGEQANTNGLDREELLATLQVIEPKRSVPFWQKLFGKRAA